MTNPGPPAALDPYSRRLLDLLGDRDPLTVLDELPDWVTTRIKSVDPLRLRQPEATGKWSAIEVIQHLADSELVIGYRIRVILEQEQPAIQSYDPDRWTAVLSYREADLDLALDQLRAVRRGNTALYRRLDAASLHRHGIHSERGPESIERIIHLSAGHDLVHRGQLDRILGQ